MKSRCLAKPLKFCFLFHSRRCDLSDVWMRAPRLLLLVRGKTLNALVRLGAFGTLKPTGKTEKHQKTSPFASLLGQTCEATGIARRRHPAAPPGPRPGRVVAAGAAHAEGKPGTPQRRRTRRSPYYYCKLHHPQEGPLSVRSVCEKWRT